MTEKKKVRGVGFSATQEKLGLWTVRSGRKVLGQIIYRSGSGYHSVSKKEEKKHRSWAAALLHLVRF